MKTIYLWVPHDQKKWGQPVAIAKGRKPRQPGEVYEVKAKHIQGARMAYALSIQPEPDRENDKESWLAWETARDRITHLPELGVPEPKQGGGE